MERTLINAEAMQTECCLTKVSKQFKLFDDKEKQTTHLQKTILGRALRIRRNITTSMTTNRVCIRASHVQKWKIKSLKLLLGDGNRRR